ncbi:MAG: anaerobic ribonucleoside-triphosphate reductase activating protein [Pseudoflavonifractor sp.]|nr:anaerobic ribonucleoside-triphosphate reductase activating protein [Alloprevotella sp.]MCM1117076.1 anaerobic ribonucleoside-triphosphate reductase activating protein [Pseudoflavonifractor sp.]
MRIIDIIEATTVDGPGFRAAVYFAGCAHACPGCHNPHTHPFDAGYETTPAELAARLLTMDLDVTLSGGDPAYQPEEAAELARAIRHGGHTVWLYTGFTFEELMASPTRRALLEAVDVVVDGPFIEALRDVKLQFRGSSNQRILDIPASLAAGAPIPWHSPFDSRLS